MALTRVSSAATARTASQELAGHPSLTRMISKEGTRGSSTATNWRQISATQSPHLYTGETTEISTCVSFAVLVPTALGERLQATDYTITYCHVAPEKLSSQCNAG